MAIGVIMRTFSSCARHRFRIPDVPKRSPAAANLVDDDIYDNCNFEDRLEHLCRLRGHDRSHSIDRRILRFLFTATRS